MSPCSPAVRSRGLAAALYLVVGLVVGLGSGCGEAPGTPCGALDGLAPAQCAAVHALLLPAALPPAAGNAWGDDDDAALLGMQMFYDARLSGPGNVRCASCHQPERHFTDGLPRAHGIADVGRNAPSLLNAAWNRRQFWDGRADSLWSQPLVTLETAAEMGTSRLGLAHAVAGAFAAPYARAFGPLPELADVARFPATGGPGDAAFAAMAPADREAVQRLAANVGKAFEAFVRRVAAGRGPLDAFLLGDPAALSAAARRGLVQLAQRGCLQCHGGPNLSDDSFHVLAVPAWPDAVPDLGRAEGRQTLLRSAFNLHGPYADAPTSGPPLADDAAAPEAVQSGAFKTPSLRNLALSAPYGHNGIFADLGEVVDFHLAGGGRGGGVDPLLQAQRLTPGDRADLLALLQALVGTYRDDPTRPPDWWEWPDR